MTTVLFLAFEFPPVNTTGMHRSAKLAKYLGEFDIQPIVITLRAQDSADAFQASIESSSLDDLPTNLVVYALPAPPTRPVPKTRLGKYLSIFGRVEDPLAKRVRPALARALPAIVARHRPSAVYVSLPPFSANTTAPSSIFHCGRTLSCCQLCQPFRLLPSKRVTHFPFCASASFEKAKAARAITDAFPKAFHFVKFMFRLLKF